MRSEKTFLHSQKLKYIFFFSPISFPLKQLSHELTKSSENNFHEFCCLVKNPKKKLVPEKKNEICVRTKTKYTKNNFQFWTKMRSRKLLKMSLFIFLYAVILQTYYLLKEKYWQGRAQSNFELWPVMLTGQTSYTLAKAHF